MQKHQVFCRVCVLQGACLQGACLEAAFTQNCKRPSKLLLGTTLSISAHIALRCICEHLCFVSINFVDSLARWGL